MSKNEDNTEHEINWLGGHSKKKKLCLKKYKAKDKDGKTVTRVCIKKAGHWWGHQ